MRGFTSLQNSAPDKNSPFWEASEHLMLSITQIHTGAFAKYVSRISDGAPWYPGALSGRLPGLLVKSAPGRWYSFHMQKYYPITTELIYMCLFKFWHRTGILTSIQDLENYWYLILLILLEEIANIKSIKFEECLIYFWAKSKHFIISWSTRVWKLWDDYVVKVILIIIF